MKNYEKMSEDVLRRINEYEAEKKLKRARITKVAAAVTPVCAAAAVGTGLWYSGAFKPAEVAPSVSIITESSGSSAHTSIKTEARTGISAAAEVTEKATEKPSSLPAADEVPVSGSAENEEAPTTAKEHEVRAENETETIPSAATAPPESPAKTTAAAATAAPEVTSTAATQTAPAGNAPMLREGDEQPEFRTLITSYPGGDYDIAAPKDGVVCFAYPVRSAMNEYGSSADYRVAVQIWSGNGTNLVTDYASLYAEAQRLGKQGFIAASVETYTTPEFTEHTLYVHGTYDQINAFQGRSDYGYLLLFPYSGQSSGSVGFNGINY